MNTKAFSLMGASSQSTGTLRATDLDRERPKASLYRRRSSCYWRRVEIIELGLFHYSRNLLTTEQIDGDVGVFTLSAMPVDAQHQGILDAAFAFVG
jgi:hypothetical protein